MERERKLKGFLIRFFMAGGLFLLFIMMKLFPVCNKLVEEIFSYITSDIVFLQ